MFFYFFTYGKIYIFIKKNSSLLKRKISKDLKNDAYIEAVMNILKGVE